MTSRYPGLWDLEKVACIFPLQLQTIFTNVRPTCVPQLVDVFTGSNVDYRQSLHPTRPL